MSEPTFHIEDDPARTVGELLAMCALSGHSIVLTGGSSVARAYEHAAATHPDWGDVEVWWSDERCVPPDDERSNYGLAKRTLFDHLEIQPMVHRMQGELPPEEAATEYAKEIDGMPLDILFLGLGSDGHVASLFPGSPQLAEREQLVTSGPASLEPFVARVTLTLPALLAAQSVMFLATGEEKAEAVARAFRGAITPNVPASLLRTGAAPIDVYLDAAAGSGL